MVLISFEERDLPCALGNMLRARTMSTVSSSATLHFVARRVAIFESHNASSFNEIYAWIKFGSGFVNGSDNAGGRV